LNKTVKNSAVYLFGTIVMALFGFANTMILTRFLSQQVYAMYGLLTTFSTAATTFIAFGYDSAYTRFYYKHGLTQRRFILKSLKVPCIIFLIFMVILLEPSRFLMKYVFGEDLGLFTVIILIGYIFFSFVNRFTHLTARMEERAVNYVASSFVCKFGFVTIILAVHFILKDVSFNWVVISFMLSAFLAILMNIIVIAKLSKKPTEKDDSFSEKELFKYGFPYMLNNVLVLIVPVVEKLIIRDMAGWEVLSIFTAASIFQTVVLLIVNTLTNIWNPIVYKHCDNEEKFKPILHIFGFVATIVTTLGLAACILLRRWLVLILDKSYYSVYIIAPTILFGACFNFLNIIYSVGINIKKKTWHFIISPILQMIISVTLFYLLAPKMGLIGVAIATLTSIVVSKTYRITVGMHYYNSGTSEWKSVLLCAMALIATIFTLFSTSLLSDIIISVLLISLIIVVANKDLVSLCKNMITLIKSNKQ